MSRPLIVLLAAGLFPATVSAQTGTDALLGEWEMTLETPRGAMTQQLVFTITDGTLGGTASGPRGGDAELSNVTFENGTVTFEIVRSFGGNSMVQEFTATVEGDTMIGTISGGRPPRGGGGGPPGRGGPREFTAKRTG